VIIEQLALKQDSGGPGERRGGFGYQKKVRALQDVKLLSNADRSRLAPYGVNGGLAGGNYGITLDPDSESPVSLEGLVDDVPVEAGHVIEIVTTGGGWGDSPQREPELVRLDVVRGLVSCESASADYGVVFRSDGDRIEIDPAATVRRRDEIRAARPPLEMFDRGPNFRSLVA